MGKWNVVYTRKLWTIRRKQALRRDKYLCQWCLKKGVKKGAKEVHHIVHLSEENHMEYDVAYNLSNLVSLCRECHQNHHNPPKQRNSLSDVPFPIEGGD